MPRYDFQCNSCQHNFEMLRSMAQRDLLSECPKCGLPATRSAIPSSFAVLRAESNKAASTSETTQITSTEANGSPKQISALSLENGHDIRVTNCRFENVPIGISTNNCHDVNVTSSNWVNGNVGISATNTTLSGRDLTFRDVKTGIEHTNSEVQVDNLSYERSKI